MGRIVAKTITDTACAWATKTCAAQGLPVKVATPALLTVVVVQLTAGKASADAPAQ